MDTKGPKSIDEYISGYTGEVAERLTKLRRTISEAVPDAQEKISWQMPTFYLYRNLVHFAVHNKHIGFYPAPSAIERFEKELEGYKTSKGAVQFPLDAPLPFGLVAEISKFRALENRLEQEAREEKGNSAGVKPAGR